ncbi:unnamed protein product [Caenorhabditis angaria]|uniref:Uncharacterized protein n=1 Tax=Caenorhabditis angaria TaxID=860376 RepID=A0A9P1IS33_9PELO|nr:unnamed protein product [Caenorhabditis angaria]
MKSPVCQNLEQLLYTTSRADETSHNCVIVIDKHSALTFGAHQNLTENQVVTIYNVLDSSLQFECVIGKRLDSCDLVCLKVIDGEFPVVPKLDGSISEGREYMMVGLDAERCPIWRDGVISERKEEETYYTGTSEGDFPGAGIFDKCGRYLGIVIDKDLTESADNRIRIIGQEDSLAICDHMKSAKKYVHSPDWEYCESPPSYGQAASPAYSYGSPSYRQASPAYSHGSPSYGQAASPAYSYGSPSYGQYSPDYSHGSPSYTQYFSVNGQYYSYT